LRCANDQIGNTVMVHVAGRADRKAELVADVRAEIVAGKTFDDEAAGAEVGQVDRRREQRFLAEYHVDPAGTVRGRGCADDEIVQAVEINVANVGDGPADLRGVRWKQIGSVLELKAAPGGQ